MFCSNCEDSILLEEVVPHFTAKHPHDDIRFYISIGGEKVKYHHPEPASAGLSLKICDDGNLIGTY